MGGQDGANVGGSPPVEHDRSLQRGQQPGTPSPLGLWAVLPDVTCRAGGRRSAHRRWRFTRGEQGALGEELAGERLDDPQRPLFDEHRDGLADQLVPDRVAA